MTPLTAAVAPAALALALWTGGTAMAWGGGFVLASPIEGRLVDAEGAPKPGVRVSRRWDWEWTGETGEDAAVTDADGRFAFDAVEGRSLTARFVPHQPNVLVELRAEAPAGAPRLLLSMGKMSYDLGSEARTLGEDGPALRLRCVYDAEPSADGAYWGTCVAESAGED